MPERIIIQQTMAENGVGERTVPIYFATFYISRKKLEVCAEASQRAIGSSPLSAHTRGFKSQYDDRNFIHIETPNLEHTTAVARAIADAAGLEYQIESQI